MNTGNVFELNDVALIKEFISENYLLRYNVLRGQVEISGKPMTERDEKSLILAVRDKFPDISNLRIIVSEILGSNFVKEYDPIKDYLNNLPQWDGKDHVGELLAHIPGLTESQQNWVRTWLRGVVHQWRDNNTIYGNQCVLTLIGAQGCRKSTFFKKLLPESLHEYYLDNIPLGNTFSRDMALTNNLLVNIDEMDQIKASELSLLKFCISRSEINGRKIYGKNQERRKRYASFVATTNSPHPLQDPTGSRRFLCIKVPDGQKIDVETPINYDQLFAQITDELDKQHLRSWFTDDEVAEIQAFNIRFQSTTDLSEMLNTCFTKPYDETSTSQLTLKEITSTVTSQFPNAAKISSLDVRLGILLSKQGYERTRTRVGSVYNVTSVAVK